MLTIIQTRQEMQIQKERLQIHLPVLQQAIPREVREWILRWMLQPARWVVQQLQADQELRVRQAVAAVRKVAVTACIDNEVESVKITSAFPIIFLRMLNTTQLYSKVSG